MVLPKEAYLKQQENTILETIDNQLLWVSESFQLATSVLKKNLSNLPVHRKEEIEDEMEKAFDGLLTYMENPVTGDITDSLQSRIGLSNETMLWMYHVGHDSFVNKKYDESQAVFFLLTILNALVSDYWTALGMSQRYIHKEEEALYSFAMASILNPDKPLPRYHSADIYCDLGQIEDARAELDELSRIVHGLKDKEWDKTLEAIRSKINVARKAS